MVPMGNIIYQVVSRKISKESLLRDSPGGIFVEEKVVGYALQFAQFGNGDCICDVCYVKILLYL
jgi:hypothetical protein